MNPNSSWLAVAGILGALAVIVGAFGAHGLQGRVSPDSLGTFEIGVRYHMYHALALLAVALAEGRFEARRWARRACALWVAGIVVFSGSLYALVLTGAKWMGAITPIGGVALIAGWICIALAAIARSDPSPE